MLELPVIDRVDAPSTEEAEAWARISWLAILLTTEGADLNSEEDCWRCLFRHGVRPGEAFQHTPAAIRHARENLKQQEN